GVITDWNAAAHRMLGYSPEETIGKKTPELFHEKSEVVQRAAELSRAYGQTIPPGFRAFVHQAEEGRPDEREWTYISKDGRRIPVFLSVTALRDSDGVVNGFLGIASDISEQKKAETARAELLADLQKSNRDLLAARTAADAASKAKSDFLAAVSHEIRTPLNTILGASELLHDTPLNEQQDALVKVLESAGDTLLSLINNVLDLSKIESGQLIIDAHPFNVAAEIERVASLLGVSAAEKKLEFKTTVDPTLPATVRGDSIRLRQILINLVGNAIKFTEAGTVRMDVEQAATGAQSAVRFRVTDTGIGVAEDKLKAIFESFTQGDATITRRYGGTGLGLTIAKRLIEAMGGAITVESAPGKGSCFMFTLPLPAVAAAEADAQNAAAKAGERPGRPLRLLLADDNEDNRMLFRAYLKDTQHTIDEAENGRRAVELWENGDYDIVFMDMQMPVMDGLTAVKMIREMERSGRRTRRTMIAALTAHAFAEEIQRTLAAGCDAHLPKPLKKAVLIEFLNEAASAGAD
ncbi:MAG: response regulator, partial [Spirochaetia bacterium]|nr:response regulator [Spirochaetia bacterium]